MFSGLMLHIIPGRILLLISGISKAVALLFFALMPEHPNYWAWILPAMIFETACVDILWTVSNVYLTTSLPKDRQGLAGALINVTLFLGSAFFVGIADITAGELKKTDMSLKNLYQYIFWLGFGVACVAMVVSLFIRLDKAGSRLTVEEELQLSNPSSGSFDSSVATLSNAAVSQPQCEQTEAIGTASANVEEHTLGFWGAATPESETTIVMDWEGNRQMDTTEKMANVVVCEILGDRVDKEEDAEKKDLD